MAVYHTRLAFGHGRPEAQLTTFISKNLIVIVTSFQMYQHIVIYNDSTYLLTEPWAQVLGGKLQKTRILVPGGDAGHTEHSTPTQAFNSFIIQTMTQMHGVREPKQNCRDPRKLIIKMIISLKDRSFQQNPQLNDTGYKMDNRLPKLRESTDTIIYFPKNEYLCFLNAWKWQPLPNVFSTEISSQYFRQSLIIFSVFKTVH